MSRFDEQIDRKNTDAMSVEGFRSYIFRDKKMQFPFPDDEFIRMWVADMDFAVADEILDAIRSRLDLKILGYTALYDDSYYNIFSKWCSDRYGWEFDKKHLVISSGVVDAVNDITGLIAEPFDKVVFNTPSYGPFKGAAERNGLEYICSPLKKEDGRFVLDYEDLENKLKDAKIYIFCNPHNPTGRSWTRDELEKISDIIKRNNVWVISDEIHCDLLRTGLKHTVLSEVMNGYDRIITCMSPSKTFNLAGLKFSNIIIENDQLSRKWKKTHSGDVNPLSLAAAQAAYEKGSRWLDELKEYLDNNFDILKRHIKNSLPQAEFTVPEATYLAWIDLGRYFSKDEDIARYLAYNARVLVEGESNFVDNAGGYIRVNAACPADVLEEGIKRITDAVSRYGTL